MMDNEERLIEEAEGFFATQDPNSDDALWYKLRRLLAEKDGEITCLHAALANATAERDAFERDYTAVGERNKVLHDMYFAEHTALDNANELIAGLVGEGNNLRRLLDNYSHTFASAWCNETAAAFRRWDAALADPRLAALNEAAAGEEASDGS